MKSMPNRIKSLRKELKLTQEALGSMVGVSSVAIGNWEREENEPTATNIYNLAAALNSSVKYLVTGEEDDPGILNKELLIKSIEEVEEATKRLPYDYSPSEKAIFIFRRYDLGDSPTISEVLSIFDSASRK